MKRLAALLLLVASTAALTAHADPTPWDLPAYGFTPEGAELKLRREFTALGFEPETSREAILEYIRERRGGTDPLGPDDDNPAQLVLIDANGKKWKAETDGGVVEIQDSKGRMPFVFESKAEWFDNDGLHRMHL